MCNCMFTSLEEVLLTLGSNGKAFYKYLETTCLELPVVFFLYKLPWYDVLICRALHLIPLLTHWRTDPGLTKRKVILTTRDTQGTMVEVLTCPGSNRAWGTWKKKWVSLAVIIDSCCLCFLEVTFIVVFLPNICHNQTWIPVTEVPW